MAITDAARNAREALDAYPEVDLDLLWRQVDDTRTARQKAKEAEQQAMLQTQQLNVQAQHYGIGRVNYNSQTGTPTLTPFSLEERQQMLNQQAQAQASAMQGMFAAMSGGMVGGAPGALPPLASAQPSQPAATQVPVTSQGQIVSGPGVGPGAAPAQPAPMQAAPAPAAPQAQPQQVNQTKAPIVQIPGTPFAISGYTVGPTGPRIAVDHVSKLLAAQRQAAGKTPTAEVVTRTLGAAKAIDELTELRKLVTQAGKKGIRTGGISYGGHAAFGNIPYASRVQAQTDPNSKLITRIRALQRALQADYLTASTGSQRGMGEVSFLLEALPKIDRDTPENFDAVAETATKALQSDMKRLSAFLDASGFNAQGTMELIDNLKGTIGLVGQTTPDSAEEYEFMTKGGKQYRRKKQVANA